MGSICSNKKKKEREDYQSPERKPPRKKASSQAKLDSSSDYLSADSSASSDGGSSQRFESSGADNPSSPPMLAVRSEEDEIGVRKIQSSVNEPIASGTAPLLPLLRVAGRNEQAPKMAPMLCQNQVALIYPGEVKNEKSGVSLAQTKSADTSPDNEPPSPPPLLPPPLENSEQASPAQPDAPTMTVEVLQPDQSDQAQLDLPSPSLSEMIQSEATALSAPEVKDQSTSPLSQVELNLAPMEKSDLNLNKSDNDGNITSGGSSDSDLSGNSGNLPSLPEDTEVALGLTSDGGGSASAICSIPLPLADADEVLAKKDQATVPSSPVKTPQEELSKSPPQPCNTLSASPSKDVSPTVSKEPQKLPSAEKMEEFSAREGREDQKSSLTLIQDMPRSESALREKSDMQQIVPAPAEMSNSEAKMEQPPNNEKPNSSTVGQVPNSDKQPEELSKNPLQLFTDFKLPALPSKTKLETDVNQITAYGQAKVIDAILLPLVESIRPKSVSPVKSRPTVEGSPGNGKPRSATILAKDMQRSESVPAEMSNAGAKMEQPTSNEMPNSSTVGQVNSEQPSTLVQQKSRMQRSESNLPRAAPSEER